MKFMLDRSPEGFTVISLWREGKKKIRMGNKEITHEAFEKRFGRYFKKLGH
jgi:hypothetical protein